MSELKSESGTDSWRPATADDAAALRELEREANLAGLGHVFGALPFPADEVLARWVLVLEDPEVSVEVVDGAGRLQAYVAHDGRSLRHLAVHPDSWGLGLGGAAVERAVAAGARQLWVLELNRRARRLYESLGWTMSGNSQDCPWPPHPLELEYVLD